MEEEHKKEEIKKKPRKRFRFRKVLKWIGIVMVVVILLPLLLYVPPIQNAVKDIVSEKVSEATGLDISIGRFMLKFPLRVAVDDFLVLDEHADTMVAGKALELHVKILPVFRGKCTFRKRYSGRSGISACLLLPAESTVVYISGKPPAWPLHLCIAAYRPAHDETTRYGRHGNACTVWRNILL